MLIVDTGVIVAAADRSDPQHYACAAVLENITGPLITSPMVIAEAAYLINRELGPIAEQALYTAIIDDALVVGFLSHGDWVRVHELVGRYRNLPLGGTDASVVALAERFSARQVATLDRRHSASFGPLTPAPLPCRPNHGDPPQTSQGHLLACRHAVRASAAAEESRAPLP